MENAPKSVSDILDKVEGLAKEKSHVRLGNVIDALGHRSFAPFLLIPALIDISPVGGIPGLPTMLGLIIVIVAAQVLLGREDLWLPSFLERRSISSKKACKATKKLRGVAAFLDRWFHGRLPKLAQGPFVRIAAGLCILLALTVPPLELLPFATTAPMAAIAAFGLALFVKDGLLMVIATFLSGGAFALGIGLIGSGSGPGS
ncbi:exopolysaccharide biosynthesis protein [Novosphingobium sp. M1R2S20]|uniref:Exopolysaccharide biosynthesis protein n=1 Tax=Novosphingobium rhizovicinum TaxID=3228928 RepID=A0ABV3RD34_9SPHN